MKQIRGENQLYHPYAGIIRIRFEGIISAAQLDSTP